MDLILQVIGGFFIFFGLFIVLSGSIGMLRFKDFFVRLHPAGLVDSFGSPMVIFGLMFIDGFTITSLKLGILILLMMLTAPTASHALAKAAWHKISEK